MTLIHATKTKGLPSKVKGLNYSIKKFGLSKCEPSELEIKKTLSRFDLYFCHSGSDFSEVASDILSRIKPVEDSICFLNKRTLISNLEYFQSHFLPTSTDRKILYALKANPVSAISKLLIENQIDGFDCASWQEIEQCLKLGALPSQIHFNNPIQKSAHVEMAYKKGIKHFTVQSASGIRRVADICTKNRGDIELAVRVKTFSPNAKIQMSEIDCGKFGCLPSEAVQLLKEAKILGFKTGIAMHTGSQNSDPLSYSRALSQVAKIAEKVGGINCLNLGGGFPVNYSSGDHYDVAEFLGVINRAFEFYKPSIFAPGEDNQVIIEPGRGIVGDTIDLIIPILEKRHGNKLYIANGIFNAFSDAAIHNWKYYFETYTLDGRKLSNELVKYDVYGETCDPKDKLNHKVLLPADIQEGDFLWVKNAGAYMDCQKSNFNGFEGPKYVLYG